MTDPDPLAARVHALIAQWREQAVIASGFLYVFNQGYVKGQLACALELEAALAAAPQHKPEKESMMELPDWACARCGKRHPSDHAGMLDRARGHSYCVDQTCQPPLDYQEALDALPDSLNRPLVERIRLLMDRANREATLAVALRMKLHDVAGGEVASSINVE